MNKRVVIIVFCTVLFIADVFLFFQYRQTREASAKLSAELKQLNTLSTDLLTLRQRVQYYRARLYREKSLPATALESALESLGLAEKVVSIKPLPEKPTSEFIVIPYQITLKGLTPSDVIAFLQSFQKGPFIVRGLRLSREFTSEQRLAMVADIVVLKEASR